MRHRSSNKLRLIFSAVSLVVIGSLNILPIEKSIAQEQPNTEQNSDAEQNTQRTTEQRTRDIIKKTLDERQQERQRNAEQNPRPTGTGNSNEEKPDSTTQPAPTPGPGSTTQPGQPPASVPPRGTKPVRSRPGRVRGPRPTPSVDDNVTPRLIPTPSSSIDQPVRIIKRKPRVRVKPVVVTPSRPDKPVVRVRKLRRVIQPVNQNNFPRARG